MRFVGITPERFAALQRKALDFGLMLKTDSGSTSQKGFTVDWKYDSSAQVLEIRCTKKPIFVPWGTINNKIQKWVEA